MNSNTVIVIAGDTPREFLGERERERVRLTIDGHPASLRFLDAWFRAGRQTETALEALRREPSRFVSLNGPYLAQSLTRCGFDARLAPVFDEERELLKRLLREKPLAVAISTTFMPFASQIDGMAAWIKCHAPDVPVIAGGMQVWKSYRHLLLQEQGGLTGRIRDAVAEHNYLMDGERPSPVDYLVVSSAGVRSLVGLLRRLRVGGDGAGLDNVAAFRGGRWRLGPVVDEPAADAAVDWGAVGELPAGVFVPVQAGQGCHCRCRFCDFACLQQARARSIESLIAEIRSIPPRGGLRRVYFTDDNLFATRARARVMFDAIRRSGMRLRWRGLVRIDLVDDEIADLMAESGCLEVLLGIESGDAGMLRAMRKGGTPEGILRGVERLAARGINTKSTFIVGYPGETDRSIAHTVDLLNAFPVGGRAVHRYTLFTFAVLPLSDVAGREERARWGLEGYGFRWRHRTMTSEESAAHMLAMHDRIREELSPSYVGDVPEWRGVDRAALRRVFLARNRLARLRRGLPVGGRLDEAGLWNQIERAFCTVLHS